MPCYNVLDTVYVKFEPSGSLKDMDFSEAIRRLNKTEEALALNWVEVDGQKYNPKGELIDVVTGTLGADVDENTIPAFGVLKYDDGLLEIDIYDTPDGNKLQKTMEDGDKARFTAFVDIADDAVKAVAFTRFYAVVDAPPKDVKPLESSLIALPGQAFDLATVMGM